MEPIQSTSTSILSLDIDTVRFLFLLLIILLPIIFIYQSPREKPSEKPPIKDEAEPPSPSPSSEPGSKSKSEDKSKQPETLESRRPALREVMLYNAAADELPDGLFDDEPIPEITVTKPSDLSPEPAPSISPPSPPPPPSIDLTPAIIATETASEVPLAEPEIPEAAEAIIAETEIISTTTIEVHKVSPIEEAVDLPAPTEPTAEPAPEPTSEEPSSETEIPDALLARLLSKQTQPARTSTPPLTTLEVESAKASPIKPALELPGNVADQKSPSDDDSDRLEAPPSRVNGPAVKVEGASGRSASPTPSTSTGNDTRRGGSKKAKKRRMRSRGSSPK
ncbi:hypothetical protein SISSUDRAFT_1131793 [Sistotremastrum suecicum HHB10207 ss-3]|uniref:Uncharacterized protein n=1 Tax=Sistotremastrum suecicum HHB10207 ss-3 TaxID=1314776 RepID=A0A165ZPC0_9AGAM|nr:hypothetical protein SISSUDRAFT_1131793 [Sistotremastrum suecicum HHB10207 ss-3]